MSIKQELPVPSSIEGCEKAMEIARIWIADGDQHIVLSPNLWSDPGAWGLMLVDLARHIANAYAEQGHDGSAALSKIREAMNAEWTTPTE